MKGDWKDLLKSPARDRGAGLFPWGVFGQTAQLPRLHGTHRWVSHSGPQKSPHVALLVAHGLRQVFSCSSVSASNKGCKTLTCNWGQISNSCHPRIHTIEKAHGEGIPADVRRGWRGKSSSHPLSCSRGLITKHGNHHSLGIGQDQNLPDHLPRLGYN